MRQENNKPGGDGVKGLPVATISVTQQDGGTQPWTLANGVHVADDNDIAPVLVSA